MKKILLFLVVVFFPCLSAHSQLIAIDAAVAGIFANSEIEKGTRYVQEAAHWADQLKAFAKQLESTGKQIDMQMQNLKSLEKVKNVNAFKDWYNDQLYYERMTEQAVKGMNVSIGKKNYSLWDIQGMADGFNDAYVEYWNKEFTEEQRREMWISLGLTPANYAYVQPYRKKAAQIEKEMLAMSAIQEHKYKKYSEAMEEIVDEMEEDAKKDVEEQMGIKQVMQRLLQMAFIQSELLSDTNSLIAKDLEHKGIKEALDNPLDDKPEFTNFPNPDKAWNLGK